MESQARYNPQEKFISKEFTYTLRERLRITIDKFDGEINSLAEAAKTELTIAGVSEEKVNNEKDSMIVEAIVAYVKANFGYDSPDADSFRNIFELYKKRLTLSSAYRAGGNP